VFLLSIGWARQQNGTDLPISSKVRDVSDTPGLLASPVCASTQIAGCADCAGCPWASWFTQVLEKECGRRKKGLIWLFVAQVS
jgi:hypothetical protein